MLKLSHSRAFMLSAALGWTSGVGAQAGAVDAGAAPEAASDTASGDAGVSESDADVPESDAGASDGDAGVLLAGDDGGFAAPMDTTRPPSGKATPTTSSPLLGSEPTPAAPGGIEVVARSEPNEARVLQESAEAVTVVDLRKAKQQTADLGEVLARTPGVSVRRVGGLGSDAILSLNGLQNEQIRTFVDGIPAELAGYPFGIINIPVNIVERIEIYRGVVPIRFGLDALGGAINIVTNTQHRSTLNGSYQVGSFGIHRVNVSGRYQEQKTGFVAAGSAYADIAENNYEVDDLKIIQPNGSAVYKRLPLFHNAYRAYGGRLQLGVVDRTWARRMLVEGFVSNTSQEVQSNPVMTLPYGEVTTGETSYGGNLHYEVALLPKLELELLLSYAHREISFRDVGRYKYAWDGTIVRMLGTMRGPAFGEINILTPQDRTNYENLFLGRLGLLVPVHAHHRLRASVTPQFVHRRTHDAFPGRPSYSQLDNPLTLKAGTALTVVAGVEYEASWFHERLANIAFGKFYWFAPTLEEYVPAAGAPPSIRKSESSIDTWGGGDSLRYRFTDWLLAKLSYEYAARLPNPDELFGNGRQVSNNGELKPERSHNLNLGPRLELKRTKAGDFVWDVNAFWRETRDQIVMIANSSFAPYRNIANARTKGVEHSVWWQSPGRWVVLDGSTTWFDSRNNSEKGPFVLFKGQRIPSRPYLFASWGARLHKGNLSHAQDALDFFYMGRYVHGFWRGWEALGDPQYKMKLDAQAAHSVGITYYSSLDVGRFSATFEVDNVTNGALFDVWGVQRPGRSFNFKITGQL